MSTEQEKPKEFSLDWLEGGKPSEPKKPAKVVWVDGKAISADDGFHARAIEEMNNKKPWKLNLRHVVVAFLVFSFLLGLAVTPKDARKKRTDINNDGIATSETFPAFEGIKNSKDLIKKMTYYKLKFPWSEPTIQSTTSGKRVVSGMVEAGEFEWDWQVTWQWFQYEWRPIKCKLGPLPEVSYAPEQVSPNP